MKAPLLLVPRLLLPGLLLLASAAPFWEAKPPASLMRVKILVEPSGAVSAAAVLLQKCPPELKRIGVVLSGGNVDADVLAGIMAEA